MRVRYRRGRFTLDDGELLHRVLVGVAPLLEFDNDNQLLGVMVRNRDRRTAASGDLLDRCLDVVGRVVAAVHDQQIFDAPDNEQLAAEEEAFEQEQKAEEREEKKKTAQEKAEEHAEQPGPGEGEESKGKAKGHEKQEESVETPIEGEEEVTPPGGGNAGGIGPGAAVEGGEG